MTTSAPATASTPRCSPVEPTPWPPRPAAAAAAEGAARKAPELTTTTTAPGTPPDGLATFGLRRDLALRLGADGVDPTSVADAIARYLVAAQRRFNSVDATLAALDLGAGRVAAGGVPALGPEHDLMTGTIAAANRLHPPPPPPPAVPDTVFSVAALPPSGGPRVHAFRRRPA